MFWTMINQTTNGSNSFDNLFENPELCLIDVLDQARLLEEIRSNNSKLLEFLIDDQRMEEMIELLINEPPFVYREEDRYKYAYLACEVLSSGNSQLKKRLMYDDTLLQTMYSLIERDAPINCLSATFVVQVASSFFSKNSDVDFVTSALDILRIIEFLQTKKTFVQLLLRHLENSSIKTGIIRLLTADIGDSPRSRINELFENENFLPSIIARLGPQYSSVIHFNAGEVLCKIIAKLRSMKFYSDKNPDYFYFLNALGSPETIDLLLQTILVEPIVESSVNNGIRVILALLEYPKMMLQNDDRNALLTVIGQTVSCLSSHMHAFHKIIVDPPPQLPIRTTTGLLEPPFGKLRHSVTQLIKEALMTRNVDFVLVIIEQKTLDVLLNLFFHYKWNNFLHKFVEDCFMAVLNVALNDCNRDLCDFILTHVFIECNLMKRLLNTWIENNNNIEKKSSLIIKRFGYIGHVVNLCNFIEKIKSSYDQANSFIRANINEDFQNEWKNFVNGPISTVLNNRKNLLGGIDLDLLVGEDNYYEKSENNKILSRNEISEFVNDLSMENKSENLDNRFGGKMDTLDDEINEDMFVKKMKEASLISSDSWGFCDDNSNNANWADFENADFSVTFEYSPKNESTSLAAPSTSVAATATTASTNNNSNNKESNFIRKVSSVDNLSLAEYFQDDKDSGDDQVFNDDEDSEETDDDDDLEGTAAVAAAAVNLKTVTNIVPVAFEASIGDDNDKEDRSDSDHDDNDDDDDAFEPEPNKRFKNARKVPFVIRSTLNNIIDQIEYQEIFS